MKNFLVVYFYKKASDYGFGNTDVCISADTPTFSQIREIEKQLKSNSGFSEVCVLNIIPLAEESADVVEVVRCKDCEHFKKKTPLHTSGRCMLNDDKYDYSRSSNDFCSYGERKEGK